jgi:hypothetical protein
MPHLPDSQHPDHDPELIAAYAAGDATGADLERAATLVSACTSCAELYHDLRSIAAATSALPAPVRQRDFRLTPEHAASLRPSGLRALLATLSGPRFSFATPLGTGLAALGIVGILVASRGLPTGGATGGAPQVERATISEQRENLEAAAPASAAPASGGPGAALASEAASAAPEPAPSTIADQASPGNDTAGGDAAAEAASPAAASEAPASSRMDRYATAGPSINPSRAGGLAPEPDVSPDATMAAPAAAPPSTGSTPFDAVGAALVAAAGIALVVLRWGARRLV